MSPAYKPKRQPKTICPLQRIANLEMDISRLRQEMFEVHKRLLAIEPKPKPVAAAVPDWKVAVLQRMDGLRSNNHPLAY